MPLLVAMVAPFVSAPAVLIYSLLGSLIVGGVPYAILAVSLLFFFHDSDERRIRRTLAAAPVLMLPILWSCVVATSVITGWPSPRWDRVWDRAAGSSMYVIVLGYAYVAVVFAGIWALKRVRVLA